MLIVTTKLRTGPWGVRPVATLPCVETCNYKGSTPKQQEGSTTTLDRDPTHRYLFLSALVGRTKQN